MTCFKTIRYFLLQASTHALIPHMIFHHSGGKFSQVFHTITAEYYDKLLLLLDEMLGPILLLIKVGQWITQQSAALSNTRTDEVPCVVVPPRGGGGAVGGAAVVLGPGLGLSSRGPVLRRLKYEQSKVPRTSDVKSKVVKMKCLPR